MLVRLFFGFLLVIRCGAGLFCICCVFRRRRRGDLLVSFFLFLCIVFRFIGAFALCFFASGFFEVGGRVLAPILALLR